MIIKTLSTRHALLTFALGCLAAIAVTSTAAAQSSSIEFPYQALVSKDNALVRSGPGKVHYGTQKLAAGQVVEVYRHDPDGWCAIRPVEGSFCIIPESAVEVTGEGVGEIKLAGTTPFVGTKLGSVEKPLWQVKLREKEKVALIGQLSWPSPEGHSTIWYQIKPPAGEFRWINVDNLESLSGATMASVIDPQPTPKPIAVAAQQPPTLDRPTLTPIKPNPDFATAHQPAIRPIPPATPFAVQPRRPAANDFAADQANVQQASFTPATPNRAPEPAAPAETTEPPLQDSGSGWRRSTRSIPSDDAYKSAANNFGSSSNYNDNRNHSQATNQSYTNTAQNPNRSFQQQPYQPNPTRQTQQSYSGQIRVANASPDRGHFAQQLNQSNGYTNTFTGQPIAANALQTLNNRLTVEMLKAPSQWQLEPLETATRQYMTNADYTHQQAAQQFLNKLANCRQVATGYSTNRGSFVSTGNGSTSNDQFGFRSNDRTGTGIASAGSRTAGNNFTNNAQFDATGWLNELKQSRGTEQSTYVLQDETGKIIYHVTPMPGINLSRYLKKRVGVNGQMGFNQRLNLKHVTIERVFPL